MAHRTLVKLEDAFKAIRELQERIEYYDTKNQDFHQRQIKNAHPSIDDYDYVVRKELKQGLEDVDLERAAGGGTTTTVTTGNTYLRTFGYGVGRNLVTGVNVIPVDLIIPFTSTTLLKIYFKCKVAPTGSSAIADINLSGTSILNASRLTVPAGSTSVITVTSFVTSTFTDGQVLTFDMDQIGSTVPGSGFVVTMKFQVNVI